MIAKRHDIFPRRFRKNSLIVYEAHSTDYQSSQALREMVEDHFAILKVGPWLTFAFREAIFALSAMERELLRGNKAIRLSEVRQALENAMLRDPVVLALLLSRRRGPTAFLTRL